MYLFFILEIKSNLCLPTKWSCRILTLSLQIQTWFFSTIGLHNNIQHNDAQNNNIQHNDAQNNNIQHNDAQSNNINI